MLVKALGFCIISNDRNTESEFMEIMLLVINYVINLIKYTT